MIQQFDTPDHAPVPLKLVASIELITPQLAKEYLETQQLNREVNDKRVSDYANRMRRGEWMLGQPITFDELGCLIDGQHRLKAVVRCGIPMEFAIMTGIPSDSKQVYDIGQQRSTAQISRLMGQNIPQMKARLAILSNAFTGSQFKARTKASENNRKSGEILGFQGLKNVRSPQMMLALEAKYSEGLDFAIRTPGSREQSSPVAKNSTIRSVFFRAFYNANQYRLQEFIEVYYTGVSRKEEDDAALALRNYVISLREGTRKISYGKGGKTELYKKAESAVLCFLQNKPKNSLRGSEFEEFPLADFD